MKPKIVIANGDHCVQMYAIRDIEPGEELCFDYGYGKDVAPDWAKRGARKFGGSIDRNGSSSKKQVALHETEEDETGEDDNGSDSSESGSDSNETCDSESDIDD